MTSSSTNSGVATITVTFDITRDQDLAQVDVQNRVSTGARPPADGSPHARRHRQQAEHRLRHGRRRLLGEGAVRLALPEQLHRRLREGRAEARARRRRRHDLRRAQVLRCGCGSIRSGSRRARSRPATSPTRCASRTCRSRRARSARRRRRKGQMYQLSVRVEGPPAPKPSEFDNIIVKAGADGSLVRLKDVGHAELGAETYASRAALPGHATPSASASSSCRRPTRSTSRRKSRPSSTRLAKNFPPGLKVPDRARHDRSRAATRSAKC